MVSVEIIVVVVLCLLVGCIMLLGLVNNVLRKCLCEVFISIGILVVISFGRVCKIV